MIVVYENTHSVSSYWWADVFYFHLPPLLSPMILPRRCLAVRGLDLGLDAARAALTAVAAADDGERDVCIGYRHTHTCTYSICTCILIDMTSHMAILHALVYM